MDRKYNNQSPITKIQLITNTQYSIHGFFSYQPSAHSSQLKQKSFMLMADG